MGNICKEIPLALQEARQEIITPSSRALFLDRDGTINEEVHFLSSPNEVRLIPGSAKAIREARQHGYKVFIITNQSGIARGYLTEIDLHQVHKRLLHLLAEEKAFIDDIYYCPHHPEVGIPPLNTVCPCRKPKPGMLLKAQQEHGVNLSQSFVIGDRLIDVETGYNGGARSILVLTGYGRTERSQLETSPTVKPEYIAQNLLDAVHYILSLNHQTIRENP